MEKTFTINQNAIRQIYEKYKIEVEKADEEFQSKNKSEYIIQTPIISLAGFEKIVEEVFWRSLKKKEGKHHNFSVELHKIEQTDLFGSWIGNCFFEFFVSTNKLSKLAPAFDETHCSLLVWCEENEKPKILGFSESGHLSLKIKTLSEGEIIVSYSYKFSALITGSRVEFIKQLQTFSDVFQEENLKKSLHSSKWSLLVSIAVKMKKHLHGGTLLIVNEGEKRFETSDSGLPELTIENEKWKESISTPITYSPFNRYKTPFTSKTLLELETDWNEEKVSTDSASFWRERIVNLIGQLTSIDGATIINTEFEILGFGAKIKPLNVGNKPAAISVSEPFEDSTKENKKLDDLGGTRHQSAAQFVYDQRNSFAIVASQDGKVSIMFWDKDIKKVRVIQHAEYLFV